MLTTSRHVDFLFLTYKCAQILVKMCLLRIATYRLVMMQ